VGLVLLRACSEPTHPFASPLGRLSRWLVAQDVFGAMPEVVASAIYSAMSTDMAAVTAVLGQPAQVDLAQVRCSAL